PRVLVLPQEQWSAWLEGFLLADGKRGIRDGAVRARADDSALRLEVVVRNVNLAAFDARDREAERLHVALDLSHAHNDFVHAAIDLDGRVRLTREKSTAIQIVFKRLSTENQVVLGDLAVNGCAATVTPRADGYMITLTLPWSALCVES